MDQMKGLSNLVEKVYVKHNVDSVDNKTLKQIVSDFYLVEMQTIIKIVDDEIEAVFTDYWRALKKQNGGMFAAHAVLVVWQATLEPSYIVLTAEQKNIVKWICLMHNIGKIGKPTITGKDHIYPFKSA